ncbi:4-hydroxy-tetrahydrodipicolinate reductase [Ruminiclostridium cellobioparum]|uniref:4-hydroxy-tetrahydrodipicolinate reductase n=1 Tax=Ruminiclostridium cellobioparum subsp. termitidis CT1112 TaxID=1195236 RepID=S0FXR1_RUMCE|nr:4-hydroxy-tetrahydrodipicolinate reductase [Ruminiclostridium cellobioparum]EMS73904.1 dihydrodipicolinate reductase [Ruminiclostridium cellobioparum subsp. termitidis CT1112]
MIKVCISGLGRTGKEIAKAVLDQEDIQLVSVICSPSSKTKNMDLGRVLGIDNTGIIIRSSDNLEEIIFRNKPDVVIDFSNPKSALKNALIFSKYRVNIVIGTTGFTPYELKKIFILTRKYKNGIVYAPNITLGVNVMMLLTNLTASLLNGYDFQITEVHHKNKLDSPSGTAKKIALEIQGGLKNTGMPMPASEIPINSVRAGGVIGRHEVMIVGEEDKIEISHESFSRKAFAQGALKAAKFVHKKSGYFEMRDVLDLEKVLKTYIENNDRSRRRSPELKQKSV